MKTLLRASLVAAGLFLVQPSIATGQPAAGGPAMDDVAVIDGDSLRFGSVEIRLWGIDAPEWDEPGGAAATAFLRGMVWAQVVVCRPQGGRDAYGRTVAMCFVGSVDIARALVETGHARDWPKYSGGYYAR